MPTNVKAPLTSPAAPSGSARAPRTDGAQARARLLKAAIGLFADKGFTKTSTREIAQAAQVNIAAISYYFGDKAGLYRVACTEPLGNPKDDIPLFDQPHFTLRESLDGFYTGFLAPMKQSDVVQQCVRLHFREMVEPTGLWMDEMDQGIQQSHLALVAVLSRHLGLPRPDDEVHRLAFAISALALQLFVCSDMVGAIRPRLLNSPRAIDLSARRLADFAHAMVSGEAARRISASTPEPSLSSPQTATRGLRS